MLSTCILSTNIRTQIISPLKWFNITLRLSSNSSSSDSSSDSDSDTESNKKSQLQNKNINDQSNEKEDEMNSLISNLIKNKSTKSANIKINLKKEKNNLEAQLIKTAETLTSTFGGDKEKILSSLLEGLSNIEKGKTSEDQQTMEGKADKTKDGETDKKGFDNTQFMKYKEVLENRYKQRFENRNRQQFEDKYRQRFGNKYKQQYEDRYKMKMNYSKKDVSTLNNRYGTQDMQNYQRKFEGRSEIEKLKAASNPSVIYSLQKEARLKKKRLESSEEQYPEIFTNLHESPANVPELKVWNKMEMDQLKDLATRHPVNGFQEMIQWTEEGKLWKFPIDNEQGIQEEERNIHFSEHVFLDHHLEGWCPSKGPVRHFMELVCIGLSKNPYITVQEKYEHIMWYKEYFEDKRDLLTKLGAIETVPSDAAKQIES